MNKYMTIMAVAFENANISPNIITYTVTALSLEEAAQKALEWHGDVASSIGRLMVNADGTGTFKGKIHTAANEHAATIKIERLL